MPVPTLSPDEIALIAEQTYQTARDHQFVESIFALIIILIIFAVLKFGDHR